LGFYGELLSVILADGWLFTFDLSCVQSGKSVSFRGEYGSDWFLGGAFDTVLTWAWGYQRGGFISES